MKELCDLFSECVDKYKICEPCDSNTCKAGFYCVVSQCEKGRCDSCLNHIQRANPPRFHYPCSKITFHYVLRFFNRFASEIAYVVNSLKSDYLQSKTKLNVVSLGCGPGSEVYGFIKALRTNAPHIVLDYQGFDISNVWNEVQQISKRVLSKSPHSIEFYPYNMFGAFEGFKEGDFDMLVLNYLLSDSQKYYHNDTDKLKFINEIVQFVVEKGVKNILFNDMCYYGNGKLDSGVGMMLCIRNELRKKVELQTIYRYFPTDAYIPSIFWKKYSSDALLFKKIPENRFDVNIINCRSKQILIHINL